MNSVLWEVLATSAGLASCVSLAGTIWKIIKVKTSISISKIWMFSLVYLFTVWMVYGFVITSFALWFTDLICLVETFVLIYVYYYYKPGG